MHKSTYKTHLKITVMSIDEYNAARNFHISESIIFFNLLEDLKIEPIKWASLANKQKLDFIADYIFSKYDKPESFFFEELTEDQVNKCLLS